jgi:ABC-type multidrug transport system ATPase subunit
LVQKERLRDLDEGYLRCSKIAMALVHGPKLLLLDHPEHLLTNEKRKAIWKYLLNVQKQEGFAIAVTTHNQDTASSCSHIASLEEGR